MGDFYIIISIKCLLACVNNLINVLFGYTHADNNAESFLFLVLTRYNILHNYVLKHTQFANGMLNKN